VEEGGAADVPGARAWRAAHAAARGSHHIPRPSISRGTQRIYVHLNTLRYMLTHIKAFDASLSSSSSFAVAEVFALRLIILDSRNSLYQGLYARGVGDACICPALRLLKQNLSFLVTLCWC